MSNVANDTGKATCSVIAFPAPRGAKPLRPSPVTSFEVLEIRRDAKRRRTFADECAEEIYRRAAADLAAPPGPADLIQMLGGDIAIHHGDRMPRGDAWLRRTRSGGLRHGWSIEVHAGLPLPEASVAMARGIARWYLATCRLPDLEPIEFDELVAAILMPAPAIPIYAASCGYSAPALAECFVVPEHVAALRTDLLNVVFLYGEDRARLLAKRCTLARRRTASRSERRFEV